MYNDNPFMFVWGGQEAYEENDEDYNYDDERDEEDVYAQYPYEI